MIAAAKVLLAALDSLQGRAEFSSSGASPFFFPNLTVEGIGEIAFPLSDQQASAFIQVAEVAPYGKGTKTKHDESVRKCWQIDAKLFSFNATIWNQFLKTTLAKISSDLGITGQIAAKPYKLLLYGPGGHFKAHRDTEKLDAMFGTLIVALPSRHEGGELLIRHGGAQVTVDFSANGQRNDFQYAAFFADCEHEVIPVKSGYRFCVVFNLVLEKGDPARLSQTADDHAGPLAAQLKKVDQEQGAGKPVVILLKHHYTEANFSRQKLKGNDRQCASALFAAAEKAGLSARLALATFYQVGELEGDFYDWHDDSKYADPSDGTMGEVYEESLELDHWRDANDREITMGAFPVSLEEVITNEDFAKIDPDEKAGEGATGNAGCTMEYWYRRAAMVLWPEGCDEEIRCAKNLLDACESLLSMSTGKKTRPGSPFDKLAQAALRAMISQDASSYHHFHALDKEISSPIVKMVLSLAQAKRTDLLEKLAREISPQHLVRCPSTVWRELFAICAPERFSPIFSHCLESPDELRKSLFAVLAALCATHPADPWVSRIAAALARLKPVEVSKWEAQKSKDPIPPGDPEECQVLLAASNQLTQKADIAAAITFLKSDASLFAIRTLIGPWLADVSSKTLIKESAVAQELLQFCKVNLAAEITRSLVPYPDWRRPCPSIPAEPTQNQRSPRSPQMSVLQELAAFMADPTAKEHGIRRRENQRAIAEEFISLHFLDLDCKTLRQGSPHTLLCTKNDSSYLHELQWRKRDQAMLRRLEQR